MALTQRLDLRQTQALVMTPQLQQAIKLLQLSNIELSVYVEGEVEQNPLLERDDRPADPAEPPAPEPAPAEAVEASELWHDVAGTEGEGNLDYAGDPEAWKTRAAPVGDDLPGLDQTLVRPETMREHLQAQLSLEIHDPVDRVIATHLIDLVDEAGYITADLSAVAELLGCTVRRVELTLERLQRFDPAGIFARNLAECLAIQLKERNRFDPAMQRLIENLPLLASRDAAQLMRICGIDAEDLADMVAEIKALDPKPGLALDAVAPEPVVPDIFLRPQSDGGWSVELNSETLPRVLVNNRYYAEVTGAARNREEREYLSERYQSANWLVKALHQRATTILKVAREIVRQQEGFLRHGVQLLRPLVLRDIAQAIGMHESTVSRVTSNKYMQTPRGVYELKYFFTSAIAASSGAALSAEAVRFRIKSLIDSEAEEVLSDDRIVAMLVKEGVDIARRTVAKYREAMHIPSSVQRRREKSLQF
ncbi:MAG TPA: RNA polymerase factor sigma-54 [Stellaceae bacterium]|nr:RNA polymerase factor sigma-54 [Stellaceae bacterium]